MGRNPKLDGQLQPETKQDSSDLNKINQPYNFAAQNGESKTFQQPVDSTAANQNRAYTENESMARDIKEGRLSGYIGNGTTLNGDTNFKAMLRVDGNLTGRVTSDSGTLIVGTGGQVDANIAVAAAVINGVVNGDISTTERLELGRTAKVTGNVQTPMLTMEQGAVLEGNCSMLKMRTEAEKRTRHTTFAENPTTIEDEIVSSQIESANSLNAENNTVAIIK
jgi:cytoskeletal protein CcmA (bactofilin family)